jgi:flagellar biosynthesis protein FlhA
MYVVSAILFLFGSIPGLPHFAFWFLSGVAFLVARAGVQRSQVVAEEEALALTSTAEEGPEPITTVRPLEMLELEVGYGLVPLVDAAQQGELLERIRSIRKQSAQKMGFIVPPIHIHDNLQLKPQEYNLLIRGAKVGGGEMSGQYLAMDGGGVTDRIPGTTTTEPVFGLPAVWIKGAERERAQVAGYTVVDNTTIMATHISEIIRRHAHELVGRQELQQLLDNLAAVAPKVVEDLIPNILNLGTVLRVIKNLLKEGVSIRDLRGVLETLADYGGLTKDPEMLTEFVRQALGRSIVEQLAREDETLCVMTLDRDMEEMLTDAVQLSDQGSYLAMEPAAAQRLLNNIRQMSEKFEQMGTTPVILASPNIRRHVKRLTERFIPNMAVLSHNEIPPHVKIQSIGMVTADAG